MPASAALGQPSYTHVRGGTAMLDGAAVFVLALAVRLLGIGHLSLWSDELFSVDWSQYQPDFLFGEGARLETNPAAYYALLHVWIGWFGDSAQAVRTLSALFSAAAVTAGYGVMRQFATRPVALLAALFLTIDATMVYYAHEARAYSAVALADGLMLLGVAGYGQRLEARSVWRFGFVLIFVLGAVLSLNMHYTSSLAIASGFAGVGLLLLLQRPFPWREAALWVAAGLCTVALLARPLLLAASLRNSHNVDWIDKLAPFVVRGFFEQLLTFPGVPINDPLNILGIALAAIIGISALRVWRPGRTELVTLVVIPVIFCALVLGASISRPIMIPRVGLWLELPLCMALASCLAAWRRPRTRLLFGVPALLAMTCSLVAYYMRHETEDFRQAAQIMASDPACNGTVGISGPYLYGLTYYQPLLASRPVVEIRFPAPGPGDVIDANISHSIRHMDEATFAKTAATQPRTSLLILSAMRVKPGSPLGDLVATARVRHDLPGEVLLACF